MMKRSGRFGYAATSLAAAVVATLPLVITPAGVTPPAQAATVCPHYLLGLHGMEEGPAPNDVIHQPSTTIDAVRQAFDDTAQKLNVNDRAFRNIIYPTTTLADILNIRTDVTKGAAALDEEIKNTTKFFPCATFSLVGYSEGAWVVGDWLSRSEYLAERRNVKAIALLGDPWWYQEHGRDSHGRKLVAQGAARILGFASLGPPWPVQNTPYLMMDLCLPKDPVCGEGYATVQVTHLGQMADASGVGKNPNSPHRKYVEQGAAERSGEFLAEHA